MGRIEFKDKTSEDGNAYNLETGPSDHETPVWWTEATPGDRFDLLKTRHSRKNGPDLIKA